MIELNGNHVMVDLETLGTSTGDVIVSIGAVQFDASGVRENQFYCEIDVESSLKAGMTINSKTLAWWLQQSDSARQALVHALEGACQLGAALDEFSLWYRKVGANGVWANGAAFDIAMLEGAYTRMGRKIPWKHTQQRCYRTLRSFFLQVQCTAESGVAHNALDDAKWQAHHTIDIFRHVNDYRPLVQP